MGRSGEDRPDQSGQGTRTVEILYGGEERMIDAIVYRGLLREHEIPIRISIEEALLGIASIDCPECDGTGEWPYYPDDTVGRCVECKGTGRKTISC